MKPCIFISAVTSEFKTTRQLVANVLIRLGYDPVTQDIFGTESGDLRQVLRKKIDDCDGLIQLVGRGYGAEPPMVGDATANNEFAAKGFPRVSYTQFEFLYAQSSGKRTWLIYADEGCTLDHPPQELDLPREPADPDPASFQAERRALQEAWRTRWKQEGHLRHTATSNTELELKVERLKDEFSNLRSAFRSWQQHVARNLAIVILLLVPVGVGVWWTVFREPGEVQRAVQETVANTVTETVREQTPRLAQEIANQLAVLKPDEIREHLRKTIEATYHKELQEAEQLTEWQKRDEVKLDAFAARDKRLGQVDEFLTSITSTIQSGDSSPEFQELTRIIQEQGVDQALAYITSQESRLLEQAEKLATEKQRELRHTLAPLLEGVRLRRWKGERIEAVGLCDRLLKLDADWPSVLHEHCLTMIELGDQATMYETVEIARSHFEAAEVSAQRLVQVAPADPLWQRALAISFEQLGNVYLRLGRSNDALAQFQRCEKIGRALAAADPNDALKQRALAISLERLGNVYLTLGCTDDALTQYQDGLKISQVLAEADPNDTQKQRDLSAWFDRLGDLYLSLGHTNDALTHFETKLKIDRALVEADPKYNENQRNLAISFNKIGNVYRTLGRSEDALTQFQTSSDVFRVLAEADPQNAQKQRDLAVSFFRLGDVFVKLGRTDEALTQFQAYAKISHLLAEADPNDTQKQRDLASSFEGFGGIYLMLGRTDESLTQFQAYAKICRVLAEADPDDALKQRDLANSFDRLGDMYLRLGRSNDALAQFQRCEKIGRALAAADPNDALKQRALAISFGRLGDVYLKLGRTDDALTQYQDGLKISQVLAEADPNDTQKQRDLSAWFDKFGDVYVKLGRTDEALTQFQEGLKIRRVLTEADPKDTQKRQDLAVSFFKLGDVYLKFGRTNDALAQFQAYEKICRVLAEADPNDAQKQQDLANSFDCFGDVYLELGRTEEALAQFQEGLKISRVLGEADPNNAQKQRNLTISLSKIGDIYAELGKTTEAARCYEDVLGRTRTLANADPTSAKKQRDLMVSHFKLGAVRELAGEFEAAAERFAQGIAVLDAMIAKGQSVQESQQEKARLEQRRKFCLKAQLATGDWDSFLKVDSKELPILLALRATQLAQRGQLTEVAQAGAKLRELSAAAESGSANEQKGGMLYNAACAYTLCMTLCVKDKPHPTDSEKAEQQKYIDSSLACLKEALAAGFDDFDHMRQDTDLTALHGLPEFEALFPQPKAR
jgi:tetratricopeptide (TPR) repeat protein